MADAGPAIRPRISTEARQLSQRNDLELMGAGGNYAGLLRDDDSLLRQIFFGVLRHHHPNLVRAARAPATIATWRTVRARSLAWIARASMAMALLPSRRASRPCRLRARPQANKVDVIYALSQAWCNSNSDSDFELLSQYLAALKPEESILVRSRAAMARRAAGVWSAAAAQRRQCAANAQHHRGAHTSTGLGARHDFPPRSRTAGMKQASRIGRASTACVAAAAETWRVPKCGRFPRR